MRGGCIRNRRHGDFDFQGFILASRRTGARHKMDVLDALWHVAVTVAMIRVDGKSWITIESYRTSTSTSCLSSSRLVVVSLLSTLRASSMFWDIESADTFKLNIAHRLTPAPVILCLNAFRLPYVSHY